MTTLHATGTHPVKTEAPSLVVTGGQGNTNRPEVHLAIRYPSLGGETSYSVVGWFDSADLTDAIIEHSNSHLHPSEVPPRAA